MIYFDSYIGENTIIEVEAEVEPGQELIMNPADKAQAGFPAEVNVISVKIEEDDLIGDLNEKCLERLNEEAWKKYNEGNEL